MKLGIVSAIYDGFTFEEMIDNAAENGYECVEVACWPQGKAERRMRKGECHGGQSRHSHAKDGGECGIFVSRVVYVNKIFLLVELCEKVDVTHDVATGLVVDL